MSGCRPILLSSCRRAAGHARPVQPASSPPDRIPRRCYATGPHGSRRLEYEQDQPMGQRATHPVRLHSGEQFCRPRPVRRRRRQPGRLVDVGREALPDLRPIDRRTRPEGSRPLEGEPQAGHDRRGHHQRGRRQGPGADRAHPGRHRRRRDGRNREVFVKTPTGYDGGRSPSASTTTRWSRSARGWTRATRS